MGYWHELPKPEEINDYSKYTSPTYILKPQNIEIIDTKEEDKETSERSTFKFIL